MKKIFFLFLLLTIVVGSKAQTGATCATAAVFDTSGVDGMPKQQQIRANRWYKFGALNSQVAISIRFVKGADKPTKMKLWSGTCSSLTQMASDTISGSTDSLLRISIGSLTTGSTYYLQVFKSNATDTALYQADLNFVASAPACTSCSPPLTLCDLICDGSFESYTSLPNNQDQINRSCPWIKANSNTPDFFYAGGGAGYQVPNNYPGTESTYISGQSGYAGIVARSPFDAYHTGAEKEFFYERMKSAMVAGRTYNVQMRVSLSDYSRYKVNGLGIYFSTVDPYQGTIYSITYVAAQTVSTGATYVTTTSGWTTLSWSYTAVGGETYATIGCWGGSLVGVTPAMTDPTNPYTGNYAYYYIDDISVTEALTASASASPASYCQGGSSNLTAAPSSGGYFYNWTPSTGLSSTTIYNPVASPSTTTTYTVSVTSLVGCTSNTTTTVTVNPLPTVTVPASFTVCAGSTVAATSFSSSPTGAGFVWTNLNPAIGLGSGGFGNVPSFVATNSGSTPISATILVGASLSGCTGPTASYTITVNPAPTITAPASFAVCVGTTIPASTFTSVPTGATYAWTNSNTAIGLGSSGTGNVPTFVTTNSGSTPISGTITVTPTLAGCVGAAVTYTITVNSSCPNSAALTISTAAGNTSYTSSATINAATINVLNDITVSGTSTVVAITSPDMRFAGGIKITVTAGATLNINGAWLHACACNGIMWDGIYVDKGAYLNIINGSVIEDAVNAVVTTTAGTGTIPNYVINCALFNKNGTAIKIQANASNMSSNVIKNMIVTCRTITTPTSGTFITNFNALKSALAANTLSSYPTTLTITGARSAKGVEMTDLTENTSYPKVGNASGGTADANYFDNLDYGIYLTRARADIKNNNFQNLTGNQLTSCHGCPTPAPYGVGIYAPEQTPTAYCYLTIGGTGTSEGNLFYDCYRGIEINNYEIVLSTNNTLNCSYTPATFPTSGYTVAGIGIYLKDIVKQIHVIGSPSISNWSTGIWFTRNTVSTGTLIPEFFVDGNTITANSSTGYCTQAVYVSDVATTIATYMLYIRNNTITNVNNGIKAVNIQNNMIIYNNPTIALRYNASGTYGGIWLESCDKIEVKNNGISSLRGTYGSTDNQELRGIYVKTSTNNKIYCNTLTSLGECLAFEAGCTSSTASGYGVLGNDMSNARIGYMIRNSGVIGDQGDATTQASGNHWINSGLNFTNGQTNVLSSVPSNSKLYVLASGTSNPTINAGSPVYAALSSIFTSTGTEISCPTSVPVGLMISGSHTRAMASENLDYSDQLKQLLADAQANTGTFVASDWMMQDYVYSEIKANADLQEDSTLNNFYLANQNTAHGILLAVKEAIGSLDYTLATSLNASFTPANTIEQNQQSFNSIYLAHSSAVSTYTESEVDALYAIAGQCALTGGNAVYQSQNLLMAIENRVIVFDDNCDLENDLRSKNVVNNQQKTMKLYPNPSTGKMTLECNLQDNESGTLNVYDLTGHLVSAYKLVTGAKIMTVNAETLQPGVYQYEVLVNGKSASKDKLIIIK